MTPAAMAGASFELELVDSGQLGDELEEEDDGENGCGENERMTATGLFIDEVARDSCIGSDGRS